MSRYNTGRRALADIHMVVISSFLSGYLLFLHELYEKQVRVDVYAGVIHSII